MYSESHLRDRIYRALGERKSANTLAGADYRCRCATDRACNTYVVHTVATEFIRRSSDVGERRSADGRNDLAESSLLSRTC